jgi:KDO2-lipid IV(A) lauroyltransferase
METEPNQPGRAFRHRFEGPFFRRLMLGGIRAIPPPIKRLTMPLWGGIFFAALRSARAAVEHNLAQIAGPLGPLAEKRRSFALFWNYAQSLDDAYSHHMGLPADLVYESIGRENLLSAAAQGNGVIACTAHLGPWQLGPLLAEWRGLPKFCLAMAAEPNPLVQDFEQRFRERFQIVYTTDSPFAALKLAQLLREGSILGLHIDRHIGGQRVVLPFCRGYAAFPTGPAHLARLTGAAIVPSFFFMTRGPRGERKVLHHLDKAIWVENTRDRQADVIRTTQQIVRRYEELVLAHPTQFYHFGEFFLDRPSDGANGQPRQVPYILDASPPQAGAK